MNKVWRVLGTLALAALGAVLALSAHLPLPWMIGPLIVCAVAGLSGLPVQSSDALRKAGQWAIGIALGLYFTPEVTAQVGALAPAIVAGALWALALGYGFHRVLRRLHPAESAATTLFAAAIGGASEMTALAERHGARVDRVAAAHALRVLLVVVSIPLLLQAAGVLGTDSTGPAVRDVRLGGLGLLVPLTLVAGWALRWRRVSNPWLLGALAVTAGLTASGVELSALPVWAVNAGQLFIGVSLGARFSPAFARAAPGWLLAVAGGTAAMLVLAALFSWWLAGLVDLNPVTVMLGNSPGGIAEMCITAKVLQLGVPAVTAFHVVRYLAVLLLTPQVYRWEMRRLNAAGAT